MEHNGKLDVIKFQNSKIDITRQLIDELRVKLGQPKYTKWSTDLQDNVTLPEVLNELVEALDGLEQYHISEGCNGTHYGSVKNGKTSTYNGCSSNKSSVNNRNCSNGYDFSECNIYNE